MCLFRAVIGAGGVWPGMGLHCSRERTNDLCSTSSKKKRAACLLCALRQTRKFHRPRHDVPGVPTAACLCDDGGVTLLCHALCDDDDDDDSVSAAPIQYPDAFSFNVRGGVERIKCT